MVGDVIVVFNQETGTFEESKIAYTYYNYSEVKVVTLNFSNGKSLQVMNTGHGLYDSTLRQYVLVSDENVSDLVGHKFAYFTNDGQIDNNVTLVSYTISEEMVERYDIVSENQLTHIANGFLACSDLLVGVCNIFEFDENNLINKEAMYSDIDKYGLYTYEEWSEYVSEEEFIKFRGCFFKIAIEKDLLTQEGLLYLIKVLREFESM